MKLINFNFVERLRARHREQGRISCLFRNGESLFWAYFGPEKRPENSNKNSGNNNWGEGIAQTQ